MSGTQPATVRCGDDPSRGEGYYWWLGDDINNPSSFNRFGNGNHNCMDGSVCTVDYSAFNRHPNTYICCTNNAAISIEAATFVYCREIAGSLRELIIKSYSLICLFNIFDQFSLLM